MVNNTNLMVSLGRIFYDFKNLLKYETKDMFFKVEIETTTWCNRKCSFCPNNKFTRGKHEMDVKLFKKIIKDLKEINYDGEIHPHFYNEPLLDKRLPKLIKHVKKELPKSKVIIYTNGDYLDKKMFDKYKEIVDEFRVGNYGNLNLKIPKNQKIKIKSLEEYSTRGGLVNVKKKRVLEKCFMPSQQLEIAYNGDVMLCCEDYFGKYIFGNLKKEKILDIWVKPRFRKVRKDLRNSIPVYPICLNCFEKN